MSTFVILGSIILILAFFTMFMFSRWRLRTIGFVLAGFAAVFVGTVVWFSYALDRALERRNGPKHVFPLTERTQFLAEGIALQMARQTLVLDGLTNGGWQPVKEGRMVSTSGQPNGYLVRDSVDPLAGYLAFTNGAGVRTIVQLSIEGTNLICQRVGRK